MINIPVCSFRTSSIITKKNNHWSSLVNAFFPKDITGGKLNYNQKTTRSAWTKNKGNNYMIQMFNGITLVFTGVLSSTIGQ